MGRIDVDEVARHVASVVGEGSVVRLHEPARGVLRAVAVAHRDDVGLARMQRLLAAPDAPDDRGWGGQVLSTSRPVRLARLRRPEHAGLRECSLADRLAAMLVVPLCRDGAVLGTVTAMREHDTVPYSLREQVLVERAVARALRGGGGAAQQAEPAARASAVALQRSDAAVWATDLAGRTLFVTPAMSELLALPACDVTGLPMTDFIDVPPLSLTGMVPDEPETGDRRLLRADGSQLWLETRSTPFVGADGRRCGTLTTATDVTVRKTSEVQLRLRLDATRGLVRMMSSVLRGEDPAALLAVAVGVAAELIDAWRIGVYERLADGPLVLRAGHGWGRGEVGSRAMPVLRSPATLALRSAEPVVIRDVERWDRLSLPAEVRSGCWVGIGDGSGVLAVHEREPRVFTADEVELLKSFAEALSACVPARARALREPAAEAGLAMETLS